MKPFVIGLTGKIGSGKSTLAKKLAILFHHSSVMNDILAESNHKSLIPTIASFANSLKETVQFMFNLEKNCNKGDVIYRDSTYGEILQLVGEGMRKSVSQSIWLDLFIEKYMNSCKSTSIVIIDDVRYENEAEFVRKNGVLIHLAAQHVNEETKAGRNLWHISENGIKIEKDEMLVNAFEDDIHSQIIKSIMYKLKNYVKSDLILNV